MVGIRNQSIPKNLSKLPASPSFARRIDITAWASRIQGQWIVDYEERIDPNRLRKERLQRLQQQIKAHGLGALLIYNPCYIRYATGTRFQRLFSTQRFLRYAIAPKDSPPILFELIGPEQEHRRLHAPWLKGRVKPAIVWQYAGGSMENVLGKWASDLKTTLREEGVADLSIGLDKSSLHMIRAMQKEKIGIVDGMPVIWDATSTKTRDELEFLKLACAITGVAFDKARKRIEPGIRGYELAGVVAETLYSLGCECIEDIIIASGGHTNPYLREVTDKIVQPGDLVILDIDPVGPGGYYADYARTFLCGARASEEQKELYVECYGYLQDILGAMRAGATTKDVAEKMPSAIEEAEKHESTGLVHYAHGMGINMYEPPFISAAYSLRHPEELKEKMVLAVETYAGRADGRQGVRLEENLVVTDSGYELLSICPHDDRLMDL